MIITSHPHTTSAIDTSPAMQVSKVAAMGTMVKVSLNVSGSTGRAQSSQFPLLVLELFPRQAIASHPHNKHCITHPQERNVHHMYQEEGPDGYINFQCTHLGHHLVMR